MPSNRGGEVTKIVKIHVKRGRVFASDRWWEAEMFETAGDAVEFAKEVYAADLLDLPPRDQQDPPAIAPPKRIPHHACLGDFWPGSLPGAVSIQ
jgi:hypothetical protein